MSFTNDGQTHLKPNLVILMRLLESWALAGQVERAWSVFGRIRELHDLGVLQTGPGIKAYSIMISCLLGCQKALPDCAVKADTLLQERKEKPEAQPEIRSYASTPQAHSLAPDGLDQAVELAREALIVYSASRKGRRHTDYVIVKKIILAFCKSGHPVHAQDILFQMFELAREKRSPIPDDYVLVSLINAWRKSGDPEAAMKAEDLVERRKQLLGRSSRLITPGLLNQNPGNKN
jgi:PPR repeat